jgi:hypothetical protein
MSKSKRSKRPKEVRLYVGTRKGAFAFRSDLRRRTWKIDGPFFDGAEVNHLIRDPRDGRLWSAMTSFWFGSVVQVSANNGKTWKQSNDGLAFASDRGLKLNRTWVVCPDRESRPGTLWCGVDPGALFRSDDSGKNWYEVKALGDHATRKKWAPGGGGMCAHSVVPDPFHPQRMYVGISAAGSFRSDDDGESWQPLNRGVRTDFLPNKFPEVGQCVHHLAISRSSPNWLFQQNHCGAYASKNAAASWSDISKGLPSRFGFPMVVHPHEAETLYVVPENGAEKRYVCDAKLTVYRSRNGGKSWQALTHGLPQKNCYTQTLRQASTADTCDEAGIYIGTTSGEIFYSRDGGDKWELLAAHLPPVLSLEAAVV